MDRKKIIKGCKLLFEAGIHTDSQALGEFVGGEISPKMSFRTHTILISGRTPYTWNEAINKLKKDLPRSIPSDLADKYNTTEALEDLLCNASIAYSEAYIDMKSCEFKNKI